jgi:hypothetical protein
MNEYYLEIRAISLEKQTSIKKDKLVLKYFII